MLHFLSKSQVVQIVQIGIVVPDTRKGLAARSTALGPGPWACTARVP